METTMMAVPTRYLERTHRFVADLLAAEQNELVSDPQNVQATTHPSDTHAKAAESAAPSGETYRLTTDAKLLRRMWETSDPPFRALLKYLADRADTPIATQQVGHDLALPHGAKSLAGMLGAAGRRKALGGTGYWPFRVRWSHSQRTRVIEMPGEVAAILATFI